jgi:predicted AlkP superfamily phosphohydrolase/phosphomutase
VWTREEIYSAFEPNLIPDLRVGNNLNYRISWQGSLGEVPPDILDQNTKPWSGDHCSTDPSLVKGIFFSNRKIDRPNPAMVDLAPTVLKALGLTPPSATDGTPLF